MIAGYPSFTKSNASLSPAPYRSLRLPPLLTKAHIVLDGAHEEVGRRDRVKHGQARRRAHVVGKHWQLGALQ